MNNVIGITMIILFVMVNRKEIISFFKELNLPLSSKKQKKVGRETPNIAKAKESKDQKVDSYPNDDVSSDA